MHEEEPIRPIDEELGEDGEEEAVLETQHLCIL